MRLLFDDDSDILLYILLDIKKDTKVNNYIRPLGFNKNGSKYLKMIKVLKYMIDIFGMMIL